jgi:DNA mismatch endonuclease (patch repair protein)
MDRLTKEKRSWNMSRIRSSNTSPEKKIRSLLHKAGYRFRIHAKKLPGCPDIVLLKYKTIIFVHGCFWHRHENCRYAYFPKTRAEFWAKKFKDNVERDKRNLENLERLGWSVEVIWECETRNPEILLKKIHYFHNRIINTKN